MKTSAMLKGTTTKAFLIPGTTNPAIFIFDGEDEASGAGIPESIS